MYPDLSETPRPSLNSRLCDRRGETGTLRSSISLGKRQSIVISTE